MNKKLFIALFFLFAAKAGFSQTQGKSDPGPDAPELVLNATPLLPGESIVATEKKEITSLPSGEVKTMTEVKQLTFTAVPYTEKTKLAEKFITENGKTIPAKTLTQPMAEKTFIATPVK
jgi:hypothetical protein